VTLAQEQRKASAAWSPFQNILLPFCYHFCHNSMRLETKVGEGVLNSLSLKWKKKQGVPQICWLFEFAALESRYRYQTLFFNSLAAFLKNSLRNSSFYTGNCRYRRYYRELSICPHKTPRSLAKPYEAQKVAKNSSPQ
jgi:hypothetical protein